MSKEFYVIEVNKGKGPEGSYMTTDKDCLTTNGYGSEKHKCSSDIHKAIKFFDKESADFYYEEKRLTPKHWLVTEHLYVD